VELLSMAFEPGHSGVGPSSALVHPNNGSLWLGRQLPLRFGAPNPSQQETTMPKPLWCRISMQELPTGMSRCSVRQIVQIGTVANDIFR
jgi:hypothetical protein